MTVAIIGILASVSLPAYQRYSDRARFSEAILAVSPYRNAAEVAALRGLVTLPAQMTSGTNGIPQFQWGWLFGGDDPFVGMFGGEILVIWAFDGSGIAGVSYTLTALDATQPISWVAGGTCFNLGYC